MRIEWVGRSRRDGDNVQSEPARLVNMYREQAGEIYVLKRVLGTVRFVELSEAPLRAMEYEAGRIYAVSGLTFQSIDENGVIGVGGTVSAEGNVSIAGNNGNISVSAGGEYHVWDGSDFTTPATGAFDSVGSISFIGQRTLITELDGRRFAWSDAADAKTFDPLNFATAEHTDDAIIRGVSIQGMFWIFKERSIERWYVTNSDEETEFLAPLGGGVIDTGLRSFALLTKMPNGAFFIGNDGIAYIVSGGGMKPISSRGVETAIEQKTATNVWYYQDEGHKFCVIRFSDRAAWVYDLVTDEWHERVDGTQQSWAQTHGVLAFGRSICGSAFGVMSDLRRIPTDDGEPLIGTAISRTLRMDGDMFRVSRLTLSAKTGFSTLVGAVPYGLHGDGGYMISADEAFGLSSGDPEPDREIDAHVVLSASRDRGVTWGEQKPRSLGVLGEYDTVVQWRALGAFRNANFKLTVSDATDITVDAIGEVVVA